VIKVWAAVTGDALEIRSWEGRRGARAATPLYEVPAALYARWGEEGDMPFFVRGVINVGFSPQLRNFVFKVWPGPGRGGPGVTAAARGPSAARLSRVPDVRAPRTQAPVAGRMP
jgi:hypothetical protein